MQKMVYYYYLNQIYTFYYICAYGFKNCILNDAREPNILCFEKIKKRIDARPAIAAARLFSAKTSALGKGCKKKSRLRKIKKI